MVSLRQPPAIREAKMQTTSVLLRLGLLSLLLSFGLVGLTRASGEMIPRSGITSGGGMSISSTLQLQGSIGQPVAGTVSTSLHVCSGLICGVDAPDTPVAAKHTYLPLIIR